MFLYASEPVSLYFSRWEWRHEIPENKDKNVAWRNVLITCPPINGSHVSITVFIWVPQGVSSSANFVRYTTLKPGQSTQVFYLGKITLESSIGRNEDPGVAVYQIFSNAPPSK